MERIGIQADSTVSTAEGKVGKEVGEMVGVRVITFKLVKEARICGDGRCYCGLGLYCTERQKNDGDVEFTRYQAYQSTVRERIEISVLAVMSRDSPGLRTLAMTYARDRVPWDIDAIRECIRFMTLEERECIKKLDCRTDILAWAEGFFVKRPIPSFDIIPITVACMLLKADEGEGSAFVKLWELPGGAMEKGESAYAAAVREVKEETSVTLHKVYHHTSIARKGINGKSHNVNLMFGFAKTAPAQAKWPGQDGEITKVKWVPISKLVVKKEKYRLLLPAIDIFGDIFTRVGQTDVGMRSDGRG